MEEGGAEKGGVKDCGAEEGWDAPCRTHDKSESFPQSRKRVHDLSLPGLAFESAFIKIIGQARRALLNWNWCGL